SPKHFLPESDFLLLPYAVMLFVALDFVGFHVRFSDVARGGIRVVRSFTKQMYELNRQTAFDEVYKLGSTQHYKNKDLPEGGSKGVILLNKTDTLHAAENLTQAAFMTYTDGMLDLLLEDSRILDRLGHSEVCFLGPDENTGRGELMDWAAEHAREEVTRFLIGGPDGDLGSNALLKSRTKTTTVVDGSGVLHDIEGLNIEELHRLVHKRFMGESTSIMDFDETLLSSKGFKVSQEARNTNLPDGSEIISGFQFRNEFHLNSMASADLFNPCGGRPASITPFNVNNMLDENGLPRFHYIVEGANVFITDDARRILEQAGCILFKDASTNKGGVTSSSFEVLAALAMNDEEFRENMQVVDKNDYPLFYQNYVKQIVKRVEENALLEFECLWKEGERTKRPRCDLSDVLSSKIIQLKKDILQSSSLWSQEDLVEAVLHEAIPNSLMPELISLETLKERIPAAYLKSLFASFLASRFYYGREFTEDLSAFAFMEYISSIKMRNSSEK
ncbi:glutamate/leucine/phenylalanine/valine dehydrogenase family protein, partial [Cardiosporidium cionae]